MMKKRQKGFHFYCNYIILTWCQWNAISHDIEPIHLFFSLVINFYFVELGDWVIGIPLVFSLFFLFIFLSLIKRFEILIGSENLRNRSLKVITTIFFYLFLSLNIMCNSVGQTLSLEAISIGFLYVKTCSQAYISLGFYHFYY